MRKLKMFLTLLIAMLIFPLITKAFTSLEISTPNPAQGSIFYIQLAVDYLGSNNSDPGIKDFHVIINYDTNYFEYVDESWLEGVNQISVKDGKIYIDKLDNGHDWSAKTAPIMIRFKAIKVGTSQMTITRNGDSHYKNGDVIAQSLSGVTISTVEPSTSTLIGTLGVEGYSLEPTFKKTTKNYYVNVDSDVTSVVINAKSSDNKQTITGTGRTYLDYGENSRQITVTAQNGDTAVYTITIIRKDNRTGDTSLKSISVSDTNIKYKKDVYEYSATVSKSVDSILISARTNDVNATLTGTGRKQLNIGENTFKLYVTSSNNTESIYTVKITRSTEELEKVVQSSDLKTLKVNNLSLDLSDEKTSFLVGVKNDVTNLPIDAVPESNTATMTITGDKNLKPGLNSVSIKLKEVITEETEDTPEEALETEYNIVVYKNPDNTDVITDLNTIKSTNDILYQTSESASHKVPVSTIKYLNSNNKYLYYNIVNIYNGLLFQAKIPSNIPETEFDASFTESEDATGNYTTELPSGTIVTLYVGDRFQDETNVKIYSYNEEKGYTLITDGLTVLNGYIEFALNGDSNYIVTLNQLIKEQGPFDIFMNKYGKVFGIIALIAIIAVAYLIINNKFKAKKASKEPSY